MEYITVITRNRHWVKLLDSKGCIVRITHDAFSSWKQVPLMGDVYLQGRPKRQSIWKNAFVNPENPLERVYLYKRSELSTYKENQEYTEVVLIDNSISAIPNEYMHSWHSLGEYYEYYLGALIENAWKYRLGRTLADLTFGIEFEFTAPQKRLNAFKEEMTRIVGADRFMYKSEDEVEDFGRWVLKYDSSIDNPKGNDGYELTTPILHATDADAEEIKKVLACIKNVFMGKVDASCGTHVHIGNFSPIDERNSGMIGCEYSQFIHGKLEDYVKCYSRFEHTIFDRLVSYSRRRNRNEYCRSCSNWKSNDRYYKINLLCLSDNQTVENRQHHGTLDFKEIWSWMILNGLFLLGCLEDIGQFDDVIDMASLFEKIKLPVAIRDYYSSHPSEIECQDIRNIEEALNYAPSKPALPDIIHIGIAPAMVLCA